MDWLLKSIISKRQWPKVTHGSKRAITEEEHRKIVAREKNQERCAFYELCWHFGGSQKDIAELTADDVDWTDKTLCYFRCMLKNRAHSGIRPPIVHFGDEVAAILKTLAQAGPLFPNLMTVASKDRANEFVSAAMVWASKASRFILTVTRGPRVPANVAFHNGSPRKRWDIIRKPSTPLMPKRAEVHVPSLDNWEKQMKAKVLQVEFAGNQGDIPALELANHAPESPPPESNKYVTK